MASPSLMAWLEKELKSFEAGTDLGLMAIPPDDYMHRSSCCLTSDTSTQRIRANSRPPPRTKSNERSIITECIISRPHRYWKCLLYVVSSVYHRLWFLVVLSNVMALTVTLPQELRRSPFSSDACTTASVANLLVAVLVRQDYMKNIMFHTCWSAPHTAPLWLRHRLALVYENGGVHSGCAVSSFLWFAQLTVFLWINFARGHAYSTAVLAMDGVLMTLLVGILLMSLPQVRRKHHNLFENTHRFAGWIAIALFWIALFCCAQQAARDNDGKSTVPLGLTLARAPAFWMLTVITAHAIYPWLLLRKVLVTKTELLSDHAIRIYFSPRERIPPLHGCAISDSPLHEWHSFAAIPGRDGAASIIVSKAGDWTAKTVHCPAPYYYMRGIHATGVLGMAQLFRTVVIMATGSGIGPCLALFGQTPQTKIRLIWSTPNPREIFGDKICNSVLSEDPHAVIIDTRKPGQRRPDLTAFACEVYRMESAEAIFFISNRKLTRRVVGSLREKGLPAFAPVFDS